MGHIRPGGQEGALVLSTVAEPADTAVKVALVAGPGAGAGEAHIALGGQTNIGIAPASRATLGSELRGVLQPPWRVTVRVSPRRRVTDFMLSASVATAW